MKKQKIRDFTPFAESGSPSALLERASTGNNGRTYRGVTIVKVGRGNRDDNNYYPPETLKGAVSERIFEGLRAFADHPTSLDEQILPERSIRDMVGVYTNTRYSEAKGGRVVGDLTIMPHADWLSKMVDQLIRMKQTDKIGISINGAGKTTPKKVRLSESGEPQEVNWLESFHVLRSADVVTEAGAGGGFQRILESARAARGKINMKLTKEQQEQLSAATADGDAVKIQTLLSEFTETNKNGGAKVAKGKKKPPVAEKEKEDDAEESDEEMEESASGDETEEADESDEAEEDHAAHLEAAADDLIESSEDQDEEDEDDQEDDEDSEETEESESSDESDGDVKENTKLRAALLRGAQAIRAANKNKDKKLDATAGDLEEAGRKRKGGGNLTSNIKGTVSVPGQRAPVRAKEAQTQKEITRLRQELKESKEKNERVSSQLRVRQQVDRAKKLLKESSIPEKARPALLRKICKLGSEREMMEEIELHETMAATILEEAASSMDNDLDFDPIEGAGSRELRESGNRGSDLGEDFFQEVGLPLKAK